MADTTSPDDCYQARAGVASALGAEHGESARVSFLPSLQYRYQLVSDWLLPTAYRHGFLSITTNQHDIWLKALLIERRETAGSHARRLAICLLLE